MKNNRNFTVRKAYVKDVPSISRIVNKHAESGIMLQRPLSRVYDNVRDYTVAEINGDVVGCGSLHVMWADLAEICALAVVEEHKGKGIGRAMVETLIEEAKKLGINRVFALTYQVEFFARFNFSEIDKSELPHKIWNDCVNCVHFPNCDEVAMIRSVL
ncbi:MAG: N-acetyltransferase [Candidatus Latescibacteria bacterium]|nr:N-acetyltransferase [Candidatus Latescibacterota bacterium]